MTLQEQAVLTLLAADLTQRQLAAHLGIGYETARTHQRRIADKRGLDTAAREAIVVEARARGLLDAFAPER